MLKVNHKYFERYYFLNLNVDSNNLIINVAVLLIGKFLWLKLHGVDGEKVLTELYFYAVLNSGVIEFWDSLPNFETENFYSGFTPNF